VSNEITDYNVKYNFAGKNLFSKFQEIEREKLHNEILDNIARSKKNFRTIGINNSLIGYL
jgi:hypothetical protein